MKTFEIPVTISISANDLEEAQMRAWFFMPWTTDGKTWTTKQHKHINGWQVEGWQMAGVDSDKMEEELTSYGLR